MKAKYKIVYNSELEDWLKLTTKGRERVDTEDFTKEEIINAFLVRAEEEGKAGWVYGETCPNFAGYLFYKNEDEAEVYEYKALNTEDIDMNARSPSEQMTNVMDAYGNFGRDGWIFKKELYSDTPFPHHITMFIRKVTKEMGAERIAEAKKLAEEEAKKPPKPQKAQKKKPVERTPEEILDMPEADE